MLISDWSSDVCSSDLRSRYVELPLFGPRTVRDVFGLIGDAPLSPLRQVEEDTARVFAQGLQLVDVRTQLFAVDSMREGATDDYALVRDAWLQRRNYQRSEEHTSELQSLMRISYAVFCLKTKKHQSRMYTH